MILQDTSVCREVSVALCFGIIHSQITLAHATRTQSLGAALPAEETEKLSVDYHSCAESGSDAESVPTSSDTDGEWGVVFANSWGKDWGDDGYSVLLGDKAVPYEAIRIGSVKPRSN